jgi:hypothetical protein
MVSSNDGGRRGESMRAAVKAKQAASGDVPAAQVAEHAAEDEVARVSSSPS